MTKRTVQDRLSRRRWGAGTRRIPIAAGVCAVLAVVAAAPAVSGASVVETRNVAVPDTDVLLEWNIIAQGEAILVRPTAHGQSRGMAMVQGAVYDAVNAIDRGHEPYLVDVEALDIDEGASYDAAIATAAHHVLVSIVADARKPALDTLYAATMAGILDGASEGVRAGEAAAAAMITARMDDGFMDPFVFDIGTGAGDWRPEGGVLDPDPWVGQLDPFLIEDPAQFRSNGPNRLTSTAYTKEFKEVKELGSLTSTIRTADQTNAAIFWQFAPTPLWNRLLRDLSSEHDVGTVDTARLMAMVNLAAADGAISCWNDKYYWNFWRPKAAIREADTDGNNKTVADPGWRSLFDPSTPTVPPLSTPPFPDHPSGHGCLSGAVLHSARAFFGTDRIAFDMHSGRFPDQPRHFERFSQAMKEIIDARVWGGIHFRTADEQGATIGKKVAHWLAEHYFQPVE